MIFNLSAEEAIHIGPAVTLTVLAVEGDLVYFGLETGLDKMLVVRPLVRELQQAEKRLAELPEGPERRDYLEQYLRLQGRLADELTK